MATEPQQHSEGKVAKAIEDQTAKLPSEIFYSPHWQQWARH